MRVKGTGPSTRFHFRALNLIFASLIQILLRCVRNTGTILVPIAADAHFN